MSVQFEAKKAKNAGRPTWIPETKTGQYYQALGLDYYEDPRETLNRKNLQICSYDYERQVKTIYRIQTDDKKEYLTWYEIRKAKTQLGSPIKPWTYYPALNWKPEPTYEILFDNETQQQTKKVSGLVDRIKEYPIEFNKVNLDDLLIDTNEYQVQYIIMHENRDKFTIDLLDHFKSDFDPLYKAMYQRKTELSSNTGRNR